MNDDNYIRTQLVELLDGRQAHVGFDEAVQGMSFEWLGTSAGSFEHTLWELVEHMRIAQWDILEFSRNSAHVSPQFPKGYWPKAKTPSSPTEWKESLHRFRRDLENMKSLVLDTEADLYKPFPHGHGQTLYREGLVLADHNAYHLGQVVALRKYLGIWNVPGLGPL